MYTRSLEDYGLKKSVSRSERSEVLESLFLHRPIVKYVISSVKNVSSSV